MKKVFLLFILSVFTRNVHAYIPKVHLYPGKNRLDVGVCSHYDEEAVKAIRANREMVESSLGPAVVSYLEIDPETNAIESKNRMRNLIDILRRGGRHGYYLFRSHIYSYDNVDARIAISLAIISLYADDDAYAYLQSFGITDADLDEFYKDLLPEYKLVHSLFSFRATDDPADIVRRLDQRSANSGKLFLKAKTLLSKT